MYGLADSMCSKEHPEQFLQLQLSSEDKKCYIANFSLMDEIGPWVLLNRRFSQDWVWLPSLK